MASNLSDARELVAEADRFLGRAWEQYPRSRATLAPTDLAVAEHFYGEAARLYLAAAVEAQGSVPVGDVFEAEPTELLAHLKGDLRAEADEAWNVASHALGTTADTTVERARRFAEELREGLSHAVPELFGGSPDSATDRSPRLGER